MRDHGPSRTAAAVAFRRAAHQVLDRPPVFVDPLARAILSPEGQARLDADPRRGSHGAVSASLRAFLAARSRIAEDEVGRAVGAGVGQYVVLGAGLDTFALRNPFAGLRVFEVDHPRTQAWKRQRIRDAALPVPAGTAYVPVDFERQGLAQELERHGFDPGAPTAISWLGVVPYLEEPAIWATLAWAAAVVGDGGHVVFDYGSPPAWWQFLRRRVLARMAERVAAAGEPFRTSLRPDALRARLAATGFTAVVDLDARALNRRLFADRTDGLRVRGVGHVVIATRRRGA